ncbi:hypothetical protein [Yinghuangia sp. YIM S09857]|uniref:hypothetical protein n=1 Tax=Yinghuangia sp. YIM S09857 TaxID=3436929 RepID=UPI003F5396AE
MTDELDRRLRGLVDDIEPAVLIAPASDTRVRGTRRKLRHRTAAGVAAAAAVGVIATGLAALGGSDGRASGEAAATPGSKAGGACHWTAQENAAPGALPQTATPSSKAPTHAGATASSGSPAAVAPPAGGRPGVPFDTRFPTLDCDPPAGTVGPLSPAALRAEDLPAAPSAWIQETRGSTGSWTGTVEETRLSPGVFCLSRWPATGDAPAADLVVTSYRFGDAASPSGHFNEFIATFATEAEAQAAEAQFAADAASCRSRYPQSSLTQLGATEGKMWKWDHAPDSYRGYEGYIRSGNTIVVLGHLQGVASAPEFTPQILETAIDRATS